MKLHYSICEHGLIRSREDFPDGKDIALEELYLPSKQFETLYQYLSEAQDESVDVEKPFMLFSRGRKKHIRIKNHVGVIETYDGLSLEILPKIHIGSQQADVKRTKKVFFKMLRHLKNSPFVQLSFAHLDAPENFPILEVFIRSYIHEVEKLFHQGVCHDYVVEQNNISFRRGRIKVNDNIKLNCSNKSKFFCEYSEYSTNNSLNRIIKTTLVKLSKIVRSHQNNYTISKLLAFVDEVPVSQDIVTDLKSINIASTTMRKYEILVKWSEIFLLNRSFSNFHGSNQNLAILFPMERIFEDYIGFVIQQYGEGYQIKLQDKSYFLVEHRNTKRFGLKPDFIVNKPPAKRKIIDTKWKLLDETADRRNYNITQADMYQLYAYGKKYAAGSDHPRLVLLYPGNPMFTKRLSEFIYEGDLKLDIIPFDVIGDEQKQILEIIGEYAPL
jgi:5-methylcytosine-specific restriction enzyme subunit McrC